MTTNGSCATAPGRFGVFFLQVVIATLLLAFGPLQAPTAASAGEVEARICPGPSTSRAVGQFTDLGGSPWIVPTLGCHAAGNGLSGLYQDRDGSPAAFGQGGTISWDAPPEVTIAAADGRVRMKDANGIRTALIGRAGTTAQRIGEGAVLDGAAMDFSWPRAGSTGSSLEISISCDRTGGCPNGRDSVKSFVQMERLDVTGRDATPPSVVLSGEASETSDRWVAGRVAWQALARDGGTGVADLFFQVNGVLVPIPRIVCSGVVDGQAVGLDPCPSTRFQAGSFDTSEAPFRQGTNGVRLCATDFSSNPRTANRNCSPRVDLKVDGTSPPPPLDLETDRGPGWTARSDFTVSWALPEDSGSPLAGAFYRLRNLSTGAVAVSGTMPADPGEAGDRRRLTVPGPGEYRLELALVDSAGNTGTVAAAPIRFDDRPPPDVIPVPRPGWVSRAELPLHQSVQPIAEAGASGLAGLAFSVSDAGPQMPCRATLCRPSELSWSGGPDEGSASIDDLAEGENTISAVAVSGAMVPSRNPGLAKVKVDLTDPIVGVTGNQPGWSSRPITLTATATDSLSGMSPDSEDPDVPVTGIGVVGSEPQVREGGRSSLTINREGVTEVEFFARDLAGNSTRPDGSGDRKPSRTIVRIDSVAPAVEIVEDVDPLDPEKVIALVEDPASGLDDGEISIGPKGSRAGFRTLATTLASGRLEARVPSDAMPSGEYVIRAEATDRAGNRSVVTSGSSLRLPLKESTRLSLRLSGSGGGSTDPVVSGRLELASGGLPPESPASVTVEEAYPSGSGIPNRSTTVAVGSDGAFSVPLASGPSRRVRATFDGDRLSRRASSRWLALQFTDRIRFSIPDRVTRNGAPTRMTGVVSGPGSAIPASGKKVVIQYFDPSRRTWRPVEIVTSNSAGRFAFTYRFRTIVSRQRILFRASSLGEAGWPFTPSASRPVAVIVSP